MSTKNLTIIAVLFLLAANTLLAGNTGIISGSVVDAENGSKIIGASVRVNDASGKTLTGGRTKTDGSFRIINVPVGVYTLLVTYVGYQASEVTNFEVKPNDVAKVGIKIGKKEIYADVVQVTAKKILNNDAALLNQRQKAAAASDGIGAEEMSQIGASDAGSVMSKMTGATTEGGKHLIMRGLGDRYVNAQLNGASLASADPDKKSVDFDLFPSGLLDNIVVTKTATPDKPGDFTGGTVNISTKSFPDKFTSSVSYSTSMNSQTTGSDFLTYDGGSRDWLGMDDGSRDVPDIVKKAVDVMNDPEAMKEPNQAALAIPSLDDCYRNEQAAQYLDELSKSFNTQMSPTKESAPINQSFGASVGNQHQITDNQSIGYVASLSYSNSYKSYANGELNFFQLTGGVDKVSELDQDMSITDSKSTNEVLWGALANVAYSINSENTISANVMFNQAGENESRYQIGNRKYWDTEGLFQSNVLKYTERSLMSAQLSGEHMLKNALESKLNWQFAYNENSQNNPDLRYYSNEMNYSGGDTSYSFQASNYDYPSHYYRNLSEDLFSAQLDYELPLEKLLGTKFNVKVGGLYSQKNRDFTEEVYKMKWKTGYFKDNFNGDVNGYFEEYTGFDSVFTAPWNPDQPAYIMGAVVDYLSPDDLASAYNGKQNVTAGYAMIDWDISKKLRVIGGLRYESTFMEVKNTGNLEVEDVKKGEIDEQDLLPSVNLVYAINENQNLRAAYGKTLARPNFREFAPYHSFEYAVGYILNGNQNLERTLINNYDVRWEWFPQIGEIVAVSAFAKTFKNPIERVILDVNKNIQYQNVDEAFLAGAEFEFKKNLGFIHKYAQNLQFGMNFTYTYSQVDIPAEELIRMQAYDPDADNTRQLQGQSPYIVNFNLSYANPNTGTTSGVFFNVFGDRLSEISLGGTPDVYEYSRPDLRFNASQDLFKLFGTKDSQGNPMTGLKLKFSASNLLDSEIYKAQEFKGKEYVNLRYKLGCAFSLGISYSL